MLEGEEAKQIAVVIPARALTLFKTEGAKLLRVRHIQGELAIEADAEKSEVTIRPLKSTGMVSFFLVTETATIPVNAWIAKGGVAAKSVIVRVPAPAAPPLAARHTRPQQGSAQEYVRAIKNMVVAATAGNLTESDYEVVQLGRSLPPVDSLQVFHQVTINSAGGLSARRYIITNATDKRAIVDERKFRWAGALAVAVERVELEPGDATVAVVVVPGED